MPTSGIVPVPCSAARECVVELPVDSKRLSKLSGARARQVARRKVLEHVARCHGNRVVVCLNDLWTDADKRPLK